MFQNVNQSSSGYKDLGQPPRVVSRGTIMAKGYTAKAAKKADSANGEEKQAAPQNGSNPHHDGHEHCETARIVEPEMAKNKEDALRKLESELSKREITLIEREIKYLSLQQEIDRLRPLSGLYRVVKAMATERKLESLLEVITRETALMLKCDRCSVFVLDNHRGELWTQIAQFF
jgi:hypothetical protein